MAPVRRRHRPDGAARGRQARRETTYVSLWGLSELRGIVVLDAEVVHRRADDLYRGPASRGAARGVSAAWRRRAARPAASRRRTAARSAATSPTRRPPPTRRRRCWSTTRSWSSSPRAARAASPTAPSTPGYKKMDLAPDELIVSRAPAARAHVDARALSQGRHAPRAGDLEGVLRRCDRRRRRRS